MPRVLGRSFIHVNDVDVIVEHEEDLLTVGELPELEAANVIGRLIARLVDDGSTIQISPGTTPQAVLLAFSDKNDLGVHTQYLTTDIMRLVSIKSLQAVPSAQKIFMNILMIIRPLSFILQIM